MNRFGSITQVVLGTAVAAYGSLVWAQQPSQQKAAYASDAEIINARRIAYTIGAEAFALYGSQNLAFKQMGRNELQKGMQLHPNNPYLAWKLAIMNVEDRKICEARGYVAKAETLMRSMMPNLNDWPDGLPDHIKVVKSMSENYDNIKCPK